MEKTKKILLAVCFLASFAALFAAFYFAKTTPQDTEAVALLGCCGCFGGLASIFLTRYAQGLL